MSWKKVIQLTLIHIGIALTAVPISGTLNRIMIVEMQLSALLVSVLVSSQNLFSPIQVFMGAWADKHPIGGRHRAPWILLGGLMATCGSYLTPHLVDWIPGGGLWGLLIAFAAFAIWGIGVNLASVSYLSLLSELSAENESWRSNTISIMWTAMILSAIFAGISISRLLEPYSEAALYMVFGAIWIISTAFVLIGVIGVEPRRAVGQRVKSDAQGMLASMSVLTNNPSAKRFFVYLLLVLIGVRAQDVLLEPYGGDVMHLSISTTSRLESIWGVGVFITLIGGLWLMRRIGKRAVANLGAYLSALAFLLIILCGVLQLERWFTPVVLLLGLGGGLMTISNLSFMLEMIVPEAAGLYIGAWGVANFAGQAIGNIGSGFLRDLMLTLSGSPLLGYATVFGLEAISLLFAVWYFRGIHVDQFRSDAQLRLSELIAVTDGSH